MAAVTRAGDPDAAPRIVQVIPAGDWFAEVGRGDDRYTHEPLLALALVELDDGTREVCGYQADPPEIVGNELLVHRTRLDCRCADQEWSHEDAR